MNNFSVLECPVYFDKTNMLDMLSLSAGRAILCQNRLGEQIIADNSWGLDPMKGMIRFGEREFRAGILGSESEIQNTWLWSWAHRERSAGKLHGCLQTSQEAPAGASGVPDREVHAGRSP